MLTRRIRIRGARVFASMHSMKLLFTNTPLKVARWSDDSCMALLLLHTMLGLDVGRSNQLNAVVVVVVEDVVSGAAIIIITIIVAIATAIDATHWRRTRRATRVSENLKLGGIGGQECCCV